MSEYNITVNFANGTIDSDLKRLVQNDYNTTQLNFKFDEDNRVVFKMLYPDKETSYITQIEEQKLLLGPGILSQSGTYEVEISLYTEDGRLTSYATMEFYVRNELFDSDEPIEPDDRVPVLDQLITDINTAIDEVDTMDIDVSKEDDIATITVTKKDGTSKNVEIYDGEKGDSATVSVGTTTTLESGNNATVENVGTPSDVVLNFGIPKGYTPIKGTDYWTQDDVKDIEDYIDSKIPAIDLTPYAEKTEAGGSIELSINNQTYVMTMTLKDVNGDVLNTQTVDLPLETMVVNGSYNNATKKIVLTLQNGNTIEFSVADLVSGLVSTTEFESVTGDLDDLATTDKTSLVDAINEINSSNHGLKFTVENTRNPVFQIDSAANRTVFKKWLNKYFEDSIVTDLSITLCTYDANNSSYSDEHTFQLTEFDLNIATSGATKKARLVFSRYYESGYTSDIQESVLIEAYYVYANGSYTCNQLEFVYTQGSSVMSSVNLYAIPLMRSGTRKVLTTDNTTTYVPTNQYNPATKKYVDDSIANSDFLESTDLKTINGNSIVGSGDITIAEPEKIIINNAQEGHDKTIEFLNRYLETNDVDCVRVQHNVQGNVVTRKITDITASDTGGFYLIAAKYNYAVEPNYSDNIKYGVTYKKWYDIPAPTFYVVKEEWDNKHITEMYFAPVAQPNFVWSNGIYPSSLTDKYVVLEGNINNLPLGTKNTTAYTPTGDYNPATKKYVDDSIASAITTTLGGSY